MNTALRGAATLAAVLAATSCAANAAPHADPSPSKSSANRTAVKNWACQAGKFHWGKVAKQQTPVAISDAKEFNIPAGKSVQTSFQAFPIRSLKASISPPPQGKSVDEQEAISSLEEVTGKHLEKPGSSFSLSAGDKTLKTKFGKFSGSLAYVVSVTTYEASFVYGCATSGEQPVRGTLNTWDPVTYSGLFKCGIDEQLSNAERDAEALVCGQTEAE
ncbi:hypothetical protein [Streptomyces sp. NPDC057403]|uniref:hypothetical protein n=1 Tax=Streptomyces sp. NPDC057403 TaxID=3346119 RepID=UPI00367D26A3